MARRLSWRGPAWTGGLGVRRFLVLVLGVAVIHGCVTNELADRMAALAESAKMPPRLEVAYVRTLEPEKPPEVAPAPPPPPPPAPRAVRARSPRPAASSPPLVADAASAAAEEEALRARAEAWVKERTADAASAAASVPSAAASQALAAATAASASTAASGAVAAASAASAADVPRGIEPARGVATNAEPFDWPASTRVTYNLSGNYRGEVTGSAQVEWIRVGLKYEVHLDFIVGPEFAPIIHRKMTSSGDLGPDGLTPVRYDEETDVAFQNRRRVTLRFEDTEIVLANGERKERWRGVQDTASQFVQLTYLFTLHPELLRPGNSVEVPLALARSVSRWHYDVIGEMELQTPFGAISAVHLKPRRDVVKPGDLTAEIWFSPQLRYLPVRIRVEQDPQTWVDLVIARKPDLAAR
jgi:hypothetical protein